MTPTKRILIHCIIAMLYALMIIYIIDQEETNVFARIMVIVVFIIFQIVTWLVLAYIVDTAEDDKKERAKELIAEAKKILELGERAYTLKWREEQLQEKLKNERERLQS